MSYFSQIIKLQKSIDKNDIVSFDVFDTLLFRTVRKPTDLFSFMEILEPELFKPFNDEFKSIRIKAENVARSQTEEYESSLDDIYFYIKYVYQITDEIIKKIKEVELKSEKLLCYANPLAIEIFNYALRKNKTIIICSDMYLSSNFISALLRMNHFDINEKIKVYVSNEHKKNKHTGSIFKKILSENKINPKKMIHIGDNYLADIKNAKKHKINTYHLEYPPKFLSKHVTYKHKDEITSSLLDGFKLKYIVNHPNLTELQELCINRVAPLHIAYFLHIIKKINQSNNVEKALFFARDSFIYYQLLEKFKDKLNFNKKYSYFYVSRKSIESKTLFLNYLKQESEDLNQIALVDLGWKGTIHSKIDDINSLLGEKINFHGFYMNLILADETQNIKNFDSFIIDFPRQESHFILMEIFHMAPHPTTLDYEEKGGSFIPVFEKPIQEEQALIDTGMKIQHESLKFISMILEALPVQVLFQLNLKELTTSFFNMVKSPTSLDVKILGDLTFSTKVGKTDKIRKKVSPKIFLGFLGNLNPLYKRSKRHLVWKEGTKKRNFILNLRKK